MLLCTKHPKIRQADGVIRQKSVLKVFGTKSLSYLCRGQSYQKIILISEEMCNLEDDFRPNMEVGLRRSALGNIERARIRTLKMTFVIGEYFAYLGLAIG